MPVHGHAGNVPVPGRLIEKRPLGTPIWNALKLTYTKLKYTQIWIKYCFCNKSRHLFFSGQINIKLKHMFLWSIITIICFISYALGTNFQNSFLSMALSDNKENILQISSFLDQWLRLSCFWQSVSQCLPIHPPKGLILRNLYNTWLIICSLNYLCLNIHFSKSSASYYPCFYTFNENVMKSIP